MINKVKQVDAFATHSLNKYVYSEESMHVNGAVLKEADHLSEVFSTPISLSSVVSCQLLQQKLLPVMLVYCS